MSSWIQGCLASLTHYSWRRKWQPPLALLPEGSHGQRSLVGDGPPGRKQLNTSELLLLLPSRFSRVRLCVTPQTAAHQAPPSLGFSRQEHWVGCHCLLQCMKVKSGSEVAQSCPTLLDPMDRSPPGFSIHGIVQARALEWGAIAFSGSLCDLLQTHAWVHLLPLHPHRPWVTCRTLLPGSVSSSSVTAHISVTLPVSPPTCSAAAEGTI